MPVSLYFLIKTIYLYKNNSEFDVIMGSYDGAEFCELVD